MGKVRSPTAMSASQISLSELFDAPLAGNNPRGAGYQCFKGFSFSASAHQIFDVPDHAKPSGFVGPAGRLGKLRGAGAEVAGLSKPAAAMAFESFAALSLLAESSCTAMS